jgi:hypothetical protein
MSISLDFKSNLYIAKLYGTMNIKYNVAIREMYLQMPRELVASHWRSAEHTLGTTYIGCITLC